jgi:hypothetical protein
MIRLRSSPRLHISRHNARLRVALDSRGVIERAKGISIVTEGCDTDRAFEVSAKISQHQNRKLAVIAGEKARAKAAPPSRYTEQTGHTTASPETQYYLDILVISISSYLGAQTSACPHYTDAVS